MSTILVTGFEPFGGEPVNPSMQVALALDGVVSRSGYRIAGRVLPCAFSTALAALEAALDDTRPTVVFALGQAAGRCELSFERVAINLVEARIADNCGEQPIDVPVISGAPAACFGTLPVKAIVAALRAHGVPAALSLSAGSHVCNAVFFALLQRLHGRPAARGGFVHLPLLPEQAAARHAGEPSLPLPMMVNAVRLAIETTLAVQHDPRVAGGSLG